MGSIAAKGVAIADGFLLRNAMQTVVLFTGAEYQLLDILE